MINIRELRIGNYVTFSYIGEYEEDLITEQVFEVSGVRENLFPDWFVLLKNIDYAAIYTDEGSGIEPIPLTEEWLLKLGFEKSKIVDQFDKELLTIQLPSTDNYFLKGRIYFNSWAIKNEILPYVHQLQNLYFALTGEELTVKQDG